jgi:hypothetical protein
MAANISQLSDDYLFRAKLLYSPTDYATQRTWLAGLYLDAAELDGSEVTNFTFKGASSQSQFRGATPEDYRLALKSAIEQLDSLIAGATASNFKRPFGVRWGFPPAVALDNVDRPSRTLLP